jgi:uncharacterized protein (TIGR03086 family)
MTEEQIDQLTGAIEQAVAVMENVSAQQMRAKTPCDQWDVRDLVNHMIGGTSLFTHVTKGEQPPSREDATDYSTGDFVRSMNDAGHQLLAAWQEPGVWDRQMSFSFSNVHAEVAFRIQLMEFVTHTWDLAHATDQLDSLNDEYADAVLEFAPELVPVNFRSDVGDPFGPVVERPDSAPPYQRLAGLMGRQP